MITTVVTPVIPGRMDQKETERFMAESRAAHNGVGFARRTTTTDGLTANDVTIWSVAGMPHNSTTNLTFFVRASDFTVTGAWFHYSYMFTRATGAPVLVGFTIIDQFIGGSQTAAAIITADDGLAVTVNDGGSGSAYTWDAWIYTRT